jgi:hypothetical protein
MFRTRLGLMCLETRDNPDGGFTSPSDPPPPPTEGTAPIYDPGTGSGIDPGQGPIGGGDTWVAPPPP